MISVWNRVFQCTEDIVSETVQQCYNSGVGSNETLSLPDSCTLGSEITTPVPPSNVTLTESFSSVILSTLPSLGKLRESTVCSSNFFQFSLVKSNHADFEKIVAVSFPPISVEYNFKAEMSLY